jgi:glycosidase
MVKALQRGGIEVILDVVFNHTAEGGHDGRTLDFELPVLRGGSGNWRRWIDTALDPPHEICEWNAEEPVLGTTYRAATQSVVVLIAGEGRMPDISTGGQW